MNVIARLLDCRGQAAGAVSAYTQEDAPKLLRIPKAECPDTWIRLPRHKWPKSLTNIRRSSGSFRTKIFGHPLAGHLWERQFEEVQIELGWEKVPNWECLFVHRKQRLFLSVFCGKGKEAEYGSHVEEMDEQCWSWRTNIISWPRVFGMHSTWMQAERNYDWWIPKSSNHDVLLKQLKNYQGGKTSRKHGRLLGHTIWKGMRKKVRWEMNWRTKKTEQLHKVSSLCLDDHHFKKEELEAVGEMSKVCSQIVLKCLYLARNSLVSEQAYEISHKMDSGMWQTVSSFDSTHLPH